ncbi:hypothetical protein NL676_034668 [Syzygium grande]|nr:hypothetical protein NL676_034668 [Syzygium grande]
MCSRIPCYKTRRAALTLAAASLARRRVRLALPARRASLTRRASLALPARARLTLPAKAGAREARPPQPREGLVSSPGLGRASPGSREPRPAFGSARRASAASGSPSPVR